jgi:hypothetical protein
MQLQGQLYFAPGIPFKNVKWKDAPQLGRDFEARIDGYFLIPAEELGRKGDLFASVLLSVCAIDSIIRVAKEMDPKLVEQRRIDRQRFDNGEIKRVPRDPCEVGRTDWETWLSGFRGLDRIVAGEFYAQIRCGLVHECRLKEGSKVEAFGGRPDGRASVEYEGTLIIHPLNLIPEIRGLLTSFLSESTRPERAEAFTSAVERLFASDIERQTTDFLNREEIRSRNSLLVQI